MNKVILLITCITLLSIQAGYILNTGLDVPPDNGQSSQNPLMRGPRVADVPAVPVLATINPVEDYDTSTFLIWSIVSGASSYKIYRNTSKILTIGSLTPIGTSITNKYMDNDSSRTAGIYWYAVVATNGSGDSGLSNSQSTQYGLSDPDLIYWNDFNNDSLNQYPAGWICADDLLAFNAFRVRDGSFGTYRETPWLQVTDNQDNDFVSGYVNLISPISVGDISFDLNIAISHAGTIPQLYFVYLETGIGTPIVSFQLNGNLSAHTCTMSLGGIIAPTTFLEFAWFHIYIGFDGTTMNLMVNGTTWLTGVSYAGGTIQRLHIITTNPSGGGELSLDNIHITNNNDIPQISQPSNLTYVVGTENQHLTWTVADFYSATKNYTIFVNNTANSTGFWLPNSPINVPLDNWGLGYYNVSCVVSDNYGGINSSWALVTINDVIDISRPDNITYLSGQIGFSLLWYGVDQIHSTRTYNITLDGDLYDSGYWNPGSPIELPLDELSAGVYNFSCTLYDGLGASNTSWAIVTVIAHPVDIASTTSNLVYLVGSTGNVLHWTITDLATSGATYIIYQNSVIINSSSPWSSPAEINDNIDGWVPGFYNVTILANDGLGFSSQNQVNMIVDDIPQMSIVQNLSFYLDETGYSLNWTAYDAIYSSLTYNVSVNGIVADSGSWVPAVPITLNLDDLLVGENAIVCTVSDGYGGSNSSTQSVIVINHAPAFGNPNIGVVEIMSSITISVEVSDLVPMDCVILIWSNDSGSTWYNVSMSESYLDPTTWKYAGIIPAQPSGNKIIFQVYARDIYGVTTIITNEGQYYSLAIPIEGLGWEVWVIIIAIAAAVVIGLSYMRSVSKKRKGRTSGKLDVLTTVLEPAAIGIVTPSSNIKSKGFVTVYPVLTPDQVESQEPATGSGVQVFRGGQIEGLNYIYKVKVKNNSIDTITDVSIHLLNYPRDSMTLEGEELRHVAKIEPKGFRSLEFKLTPRNDCVDGRLVTAVNYMDSKNEFHTLPVEPIEIKSVCDLMGPLEITEDEFDKLIGSWATTREVFNFEGEDPRALLADMPTILKSKNFFTVNLRQFPTETMFNAEVKAIAVGKYTRKKLAIDVILEANIVLGEGTVTCTGLAEDPSMLVACLQEVLGAFRKRLERFWDTRVSKLRDVINIQHMLVIHKESGTAIMSQNYAGEKIDGNLISGFLTAMNSFQSEIAVKKRDAPGKKGFLLDYADFKILLEDGEFIRAAFILETDPSETIKERLSSFIQRFESLYRNKLRAWRGNLNDIEGGDIIFEEMFEMSLLYPHIVNPTANPGNLGKIARAVYAMGQAISKDKPYFFLATLMDYAIKGLQESQQRIFSTIYDLKKNHAIEPTMQSKK